MINRLKQIVDTSYNILINKINYGNISIDNEAAMQLQFAYILKSIGVLYEYSLDERFSVELEKEVTLNSSSFKSKGQKAKIDILLKLADNKNTYKCAIELKYFKHKNHREPNNRYDVFADIANLELYKNNGIDMGYFVVGTDHPHYVTQASYSEDTKDFDLRDNTKYRKGTTLSYRADKPYADIILQNNYEFKWDKFKNKYFLILEV